VSPVPLSPRPCRSRHVSPQAQVAGDLPPQEVAVPGDDAEQVVEVVGHPARQRPMDSIFWDCRNWASSRSFSVMSAVDTEPARPSRNSMGLRAIFHLHDGAVLLPMAEDATTSARNRPRAFDRTQEVGHVLGGAGARWPSSEEFLTE
jgi:hypothetical protein